tara:strand:- start:5789 stop:5962 length:174 start_codon:yes stop_codon:yes gene_type:complete
MKGKDEVKPHMMYSPDGKKAVMAKNKKEHLALKAKGFGHSKPSMKMAKKKAAKGGMM